MMVKVWNENDYDFESFYKGDPIKIPAHKFIEMEFYDAHDFKGQYHQISKLASGEQDPKTKKIIRIEKIEDNEPTLSKPVFTCMQCKASRESQDELDAHIRVKHADAATLSIPEEDARIERKRGRPAKAS